MAFCKPISHPLGSKIGRKPMVNPSKWANLKSNFLKFHHQNQGISSIEKAMKAAHLRAFLAFLSCRLALAELRARRAALRPYCSCWLWIWRKHTASRFWWCAPRRCSPPATPMCRRKLRKSFSQSMAILYGNLYDNTVTVNRIFTGMRNRRSLLM